MPLAANVVVALVAALHLGFLVLEMFLWKRPMGQRVFGLPRDVMVSSAALAANQGLYNGFIAAGLVWGLLAGPAGFAPKVFFLSCVVVAGAFGAATAKRSILWVQGVPGALALLLVLLARG
jgi:putative membrane protein